MKKTVVAAALGECVHVAGITKFLRLAELAEWKTIFLGPAVPIEKVLEVARSEKADLVGVSYRLTPETGERLLGEFAEAADDLRNKGVRFAFAGTPPIAEKARLLGFFDRVFVGGESEDQVLGYLKGQTIGEESEKFFPQNTIDRIHWKEPYPLIRHHFGLSTMDATLSGVSKLAESEVLDVISLGIDQDAQENFFHPDRQNPRQKGAGGVPVRSRQDYEALYLASRKGNYPLIRTYSGTNDFIRLARMYTETIQNAWCAIPLYWFNQMDGRGPFDLIGSIREHQKVMAWYGSRNIPVEVNEPHHWGMRDASDVVCIVSAYLSAYNARAFGVKDYIAQLMFNSPPGLSDSMDLAKMLAILQIIEPLRNSDFNIWSQTRTGLLSYPLDQIAARAHLVASIYLQMSLKPHIIHVVGFNEADHAATPEDVIESSSLARRAIENALNGAPDMTADPLVQNRVRYLVHRATMCINSIKELPSKSIKDPLIDPENLALAVTLGILDAPQLLNNPYAKGKSITKIIDGACEEVNSEGKPLSEKDRLADLVNHKRK